MPDPILVAKHGDIECHLLPALANRHGLITGATGTGKTFTLQKLAESFSALGIPVFMADIKGDLTGITQKGSLGAKLAKVLQERGLELLALRSDRDCVWAQYTVFVPQRERVQAALQAAGVPTAVHYPKPAHHQPAYAGFAPLDACPNSIAAAQRVMSLPMSADLGEADQDRVVAALADALAAL